MSVRCSPWCFNSSRLVARPPAWLNLIDYICGFCATLINIVMYKPFEHPDHMIYIFWSRALQVCYCVPWNSGRGGYAVFRNEHHILSSAIFYFCSAVFVLKVFTVTFDNTNFRDFLPTHSLFVDSWRARLGNEGKGWHISFLSEAPAAPDVASYGFKRCAQNRLFRKSTIKRHITELVEIYKTTSIGIILKDKLDNCLLNSGKFGIRWLPLLAATSRMSRPQSWLRRKPRNTRRISRGRG